MPVLAKPTFFQRIGTTMPRQYKWNHNSEVPADRFEVGIPASGAGGEVIFGTKDTVATDGDPFTLPNGVAPLGTRNVAVRAVKGTLRSGWSNEIVETFTFAAPSGFEKLA
jgi:hypothetical protein